MQNKNRALFLATLSLAVLMPLQATAASWNSPQPAQLNLARLGFAETHLNYAEPPSKPYYDTENGYFPGISLDLESIGSGLYMRYGLFYGAGNINYDGSIQKTNPITRTVSTTPYQGKSREWLLSQHADIGPAFALSRRTLLAPFVGVGMRYWRRKAGNDSPAHVHERYLRVPLEFGVMERYAMTSRLQAELEVGGDYGLYNHIDTPVGSARLGHNWGFLSRLTFDYRLTRGLGLFVQASYRQFTSSRGDLSAYYYEPESRTRTQRYVIGLELQQF